MAAEEVKGAASRRPALQASGPGSGVSGPGWGCACRGRAPWPLPVPCLVSAVALSVASALEKAVL